MKTINDNRKPEDSLWLKRFALLAFAAGVVTMLLVIANGVINYDPSRVNSDRDESANINGVVSSLSFYKSFVTFRLHESNDTFTIYAFYNESSVEPDFAGFIRRGDSIVKASYSDSVYVIRGGKTFAWSIRGKK